MSYELRLLERIDGSSKELIWEDAGRGDGPLPRSTAPLPAEARRLVAFRGGAPAARIAFGARSGFSGAAGNTGYVGWYAARDGGAGVRLLREASHRLRAAGAARVIGPLDGSTWYRYRVTLPRDGEVDDGEPFLSEPRNPETWPAQFEAAGFRPLLEYETRRVREPAAAPGLWSKREALAARGVRLRALSLADYDTELNALYRLSLEAFEENPFYTPISRAEFGELYTPLRPLLDPELIRLAEAPDGRLLGYVFAFPDALAPRAKPRIVLKTLAVKPEARGSGIAAVLVDEIHSAGAARGASVLHALMQVTNASRTISNMSASEPFRRYRLYRFGEE